MTGYNTIAQLLRDPKATPDKRRAFVKSWLQETYGIDYNLNPEYFDEMTKPQAHDGQPPHFHRVQLPSTYGVVYAELVKDSFGKWSIAVDADPEFKGRTILAPDESAAQSQQNADVLNEYVAMLASPQGGTQLQQVNLLPDTQDAGPYSDFAGAAPGVISASDIPGYLLAPTGTPLPGVRFSNLEKLAA